MKYFLNTNSIFCVLELLSFVDFDMDIRLLWNDTVIVMGINHFYSPTDEEHIFKQTLISRALAEVGVVL